MNLLSHLKENSIVLATNNKHKTLEIQFLLSSLNIKVLSASELTDKFNVEETGNTFESNALLKAKQCYELTKKICLSDDSGLVIDALDGRPGVYSARYGGEKLNDEERCNLILSEMENIESGKRTARFVCILSLYNGDEKNFLSKTFKGFCEGLIISNTREMKSGNGFGYDPIFLDTKLNKTFANMSFEEKNKRSHRFFAIQELINFLTN